MRYTNPTQIEMNNHQPIVWNNKNQSIKHLGVFLNEKLTWKIHIDKKLNQAYTRMKIFYPPINYSSTLQIKFSLSMYTPLVRPLITYACSVWAAISSTKMKNYRQYKINFSE